MGSKNWIFLNSESAVAKSINLAPSIGGVTHTHQLKKNKGSKKEKMSRTLMNNCEKVKFLLWEVSQNLSLMVMGGTP